MITKKGRKSNVATLESASSVENTRESGCVEKTARDPSNPSVISLCRSVLKQQLTKGLPNQRHTNNETPSVQRSDQEHRYKIMIGLKSVHFFEFRF
jgi:hypothetical protein